jgi:hypothetical protein
MLSVAIAEENTIGDTKNCRDKAEEKNGSRISDEEERRIALVKGKAREVSLPWNEKQQE